MSAKDAESVRRPFEELARGILWKIEGNEINVNEELGITNNNMREEDMYLSHSARRRSK